jgi:predicted TIM-barrel fold metal-dependent hydrolase
MLHLPRKGRLADDENIRELKQLRQRYPDVSIIIAHFGRSFCPYYLREGLRKLSNFEGFYFDTSAVINPEVYDVALSQISSPRILYGSDMPVTLWHGRRTWSERDYRNLCREDFTWNREHEPPHIEKGYTLFLYEEIRAILDAIERHGLSLEQKEGIFSANAKRALKIGGHIA